MLRQIDGTIDTKCVLKIDSKVIKYRMKKLKILIYVLIKFENRKDILFHG